MKQKGFTLIELVVVIVILGILAATALPKFVDLSDDAQKAATKGVAGALNSAYAINYGAHKVSSSKGVAVDGAQGTVCTTAQAGLVMTGGVPATYTIGNGATNMDCSVVGNDSKTGTCTVAGPTQPAVEYTYICVNP